MAASDCEWAHSLLRGAHEQLGDRHVSVPGGLALAPRARAAQSHRVRLLGASGALVVSLSGMVGGAGVVKTAGRDGQTLAMISTSGKQAPTTNSTGRTAQVTTTCVGMSPPLPYPGVCG